MRGRDKEKTIKEGRKTNAEIYKWTDGKTGKYDRKRQVRKEKGRECNRRRQVSRHYRQIYI